MRPTWSQLLLGAELADMQEVDYRNTLAIASLIDLLVDKGVITRAELGRKSAALDGEAERQALAAAREHPAD